MPVLGPGDALPARPSRVVVAGASGSGKTTLARAVSAVLGVSHTETDALFHGPGWTRRPEFEADVTELAAAPRWVTEYQYDEARPRLLAACDLLIALQLPRRVVMTRLVRRTLRRRWRRELLWNGNVEAPLHTFLTDRDHIVRWGWRTAGSVPARVEHALAVRPELPVVVLRRAADVRAWLTGPFAAVA